MKLWDGLPLAVTAVVLLSCLLLLGACARFDSETLPSSSSLLPTEVPILGPSPTNIPQPSPTLVPVPILTLVPILIPTLAPIPIPTPTPVVLVLIATPTPSPVIVVVTATPTPTHTPTPMPTPTFTPTPTATVTPFPTPPPGVRPTFTPTPTLTPPPTLTPTVVPTPTQAPTSTPTLTPTPTAIPTPTPLPQIALLLSEIRDSLVIVQTGEKTVTGLVVGDGLTVITSAIVLDTTRTTPTTFVSVLHGTMQSSTGVVQNKDTAKDLAIIRIQGRNSYPPTDISFEGLPAIGENIVVVGYARQTLDVPSIARGVITSLRGSVISDLRFLETDAWVSEGSFGGPLLSLQGEVLGIVVNSTSLMVGNQLEHHAYAINTAVLREFLEASGFASSSA
jgi:hypothetical protein